MCVEAAEIAADFRPSTGYGDAKREDRAADLARQLRGEADHICDSLIERLSAETGLYLEAPDARAPAARGGGRRLPLRPVCRVDPRRRRRRPRLPPLGHPVGRRVRPPRRLGGRVRPAAPRGRHDRPGAPARAASASCASTRTAAPTDSSPSGASTPAARHSSVAGGRARRPSDARTSPTTSSRPPGP